MQSERAAGHGMTEPQARGRAAGDTRASRFAQERPPTALSWCSAGWHPRSYSAAIKYWLQLCYPHAVLRRDSIHAERAARCATADDRGGAIASPSCCWHSAVRARMAWWPAALSPLPCTCRLCT